jgi:dienelactone hydrolase
MGLKTLLVGCSMAISLATSLFTSQANAEPIGGVRPSEGLQAPAFGQAIPDSLDQHLPVMANGLNESVIQVPEGDIALETTVFKPDGAGPFPMIVFNHGKLPGDAHNQPRNRPVALAREFVRHGYVVVVPNRRGFAGSGGQYAGHGCDVEANGFAQAQDVAATVDYMSQQAYVDKTHIVVAGTSHGGLTTIAYGARGAVAAPGVRGLINFSGGLRQDECEGWQKNLVDAFGDYGQHVRLPSLWMYGDNDSVWQGDLSTKMYTSFVSHGARAEMTDFGKYKNDAHRLVGDRDGVQVWWPRVKTFLAQIGMPTAVQYQVAEPSLPKATDFANLDSVNAVPYVDENGREGYRNFLNQYSSRAFAVSDSGAWSWAEGGDDPMAVALASCQKQSSDPCKLYAVDNRIVWKDQAADTQTASN